MDTSPRRIQAPAYAGKKVAQSGLSEGPLAGETIVFTASLKIARQQAANTAASAGCDVADSVTKKTTILVVGNQDLQLTKGKEKSSKHRKAEDMIANGAAKPRTAARSNGWPSPTVLFDLKWVRA